MQIFYDIPEYLVNNCNFQNSHITTILLYNATVDLGHLLICFYLLGLYLSNGIFQYNFHQL